MNQLPPELLNQIIKDCAIYSSSRVDYRHRLDSLLSLCLVNRQSREIAQPLLSQVVVLASKRAEQILKKEEVSKRVLSCNYDDRRNQYKSGPPSEIDLSPFTSLRELRIVRCGYLVLTSLDGHPHLTRMIVEDTDITLERSSGTFTIPNLLELSLRHVQVTINAFMSNWTNPGSFLSLDHFPSLQALACVRYNSLLIATIQAVIREPIPADLLAQLEFLSVDEFDEIPDDRSLIQSPIPIPFLYDVDHSHLTTNWGRHSLPSGPLSREHIRIRLPCEPIPHRREIEAALFLAEDLVNESQVLKVLYLDLFPRDGKYQLDEDLRNRIEHLEDPRRSRKVEIVWEDSEKDFCCSLVSLDFWRRSKDRKGNL